MVKWPHQPQEDEQLGRVKGFWQKFSVFQVPADIVPFRGKAEARILLYLFMRARGFSYHSISQRDVCFVSRIETMAEKTSMTVRSVERGLANLAEQKLIYRANNRTSDRRRGRDGHFLAATVTLLNSHTGEILQTCPNNYALCLKNNVKPYLTIPSIALDEIFGMKKSSLVAVYLTTFLFASRFASETFSVYKQSLREASQMGRNAFNSAFKKLQQKNLLNYSRGILTIHDPATQKPVERWKKEPPWIQHDNAHYKILDHSTVTPEQWKSVMEDQKVLGHELQWLNAAMEGWSQKRECPMCHECFFCVDIHKARAICFRSTKENAKGGCGLNVSLAKLVKLLCFPDDKYLKTNTLQFIKDFIENEERKKYEP
jgi:hypothetical protein